MTTQDEVIACNGGTSGWPGSQRDERPETSEFLVCSDRELAEAVSGRSYLSLVLPRAAGAVAETLARVPDVRAVLWTTVEDVVHVVTVLDARTDEAILSVAEQELALMHRMPEFEFDFRTAECQDMAAYVAGGYTLIFENQDNDNSAAA